MKEFTIEWLYDTKESSIAKNYFERLSPERQDKTMILFKRMGEHGKINNKTKFRHEGDKIYAFKPKPDRFLCFFFKGKKIIVTNAFMKKQDKLPAVEKERALSLMKNYETRVKQGKYYD